MISTILIIAVTLVVGRCNIHQLVLRGVKNTVEYEEKRDSRRVGRCLQFQRVNKENAVVTWDMLLMRKGKEKQKNIKEERESGTWLSAIE